MPEPMTLATVGVMALAEGVKFLYSEATEALKLWRARKAKELESPRLPEPLPEAIKSRPIPPVFDGEIQSRAPDLDAVEKLSESLAAARRDVADLVEGIESVDANSAEQLARIDALRRLVEAAFSHRLTFKGEARAASDLNLKGQVDIDELKAYAAGVRVKNVRGGNVTGSARAKKVEEGGQLFGVDAGDVG